MKKIILALGLLIASSSFVTTEAQRISVNINIGSQPAWGPVGYNYVDYYYMPDINVYYNVPHSMFYYLDRGRWISAQYLPYSYRNYDFYTMYKVVLNDRDPWHYNSRHVKSYGHYRGHRDQRVIYYSNDNRYSSSRNNRVAWYNDRQNNRDNNKSRHNDNRSSSRVSSSTHKSRVEKDNRSSSRNDKVVQKQRSNSSDRSSNTRQSGNGHSVTQQNSKNSRSSSSTANRQQSSERTSRSQSGRSSR